MDISINERKKISTSLAHWMFFFSLLKMSLKKENVSFVIVSNIDDIYKPSRFFPRYFAQKFHFLSLSLINSMWNSHWMIWYINIFLWHHSFLIEWFLQANSISTVGGCEWETFAEKIKQFTGISKEHAEYIDILFFHIQWKV